MLLETQLTPNQEEEIRMIVTSGDLLLTVVNDILDYSKLESGNVEINVKECNLQDVMNAVVHSIESKSVDKKLSVRKSYDTGTESISGASLEDSLPLRCGLNLYFFLCTL